MAELKLGRPTSMTDKTPALSPRQSPHMKSLVKCRSKSAPKTEGSRLLPLNSKSLVEYAGISSSSAVTYKVNKELVIFLPGQSLDGGNNVTDSRQQAIKTTDQGVQANVLPISWPSATGVGIAVTRGHGLLYSASDSQGVHPALASTELKTTSRKKCLANANQVGRTTPHNGRIVSMRDGQWCLVKASLVLHIDNRPSGDTLLTPRYRDSVLTIVTASRHHPYHGCRRDITDVTVTYDSHGEMVLLEVPYIECGIYRVVTLGQVKPQPKFKRAAVQQTHFVFCDSTDDMPLNSQYVILGDLCQIPTKHTRLNKCVWNERLVGFLDSHTFRKFTLPLLLGHGEPNGWADIEGCENVQPIFLKDRLDHEQWAWLENIHVPDMPPTDRHDNRELVEPPTIPTDVPFCQHIYQTYIRPLPQRAESSDEEEESSDVSSCVDYSSARESCFDDAQTNPPSLSPNKTVPVMRGSEQTKRRKRKRVFTSRKNKRFVLNVKSLCGFAAALGKSSTKKRNKNDATQVVTDKSRGLAQARDIGESSSFDQLKAPDGDVPSSIPENQTDIEASVIKPKSELKKPQISKHCDKPESPRKRSESCNDNDNASAGCSHAKRSRKIKLACACSDCRKYSQKTSSPQTKAISLGVGFKSQIEVTIPGTDRR